MFDLNAISHSRFEKNSDMVDDPSSLTLAVTLVWLLNSHVTCVWFFFWFRFTIPTSRKIDFNYLSFLLLFRINPEIFPSFSFVFIFLKLFLCVLNDSFVNPRVYLFLQPITPFLTQLSFLSQTQFHNFFVCFDEIGSVSCVRERMLLLFFEEPHCGVHCESALSYLFRWQVLVKYYGALWISVLVLINEIKYIGANLNATAF